MTALRSVPLRYESAEQKFAAAFADPSFNKPSWFVRVEEASAFLDVHGVDFIAFVTYEGAEAPTRIPVQIKGSSKKKKQYFRKHPEAAAAKVIVYVVTKGDTLAEVRDWFFRELRGAVAARRDYEPFFKQLESKPLGKGGERRQYGIELKRHHRRTRSDPATPMHPQLVRAWDTRENFLTDVQRLADRFKPAL